MLACSPLAKRMLRKLGWNKEVHKMSRKLSEDLHNPYLFSEYKAGEYEYEVSADGKSATGSLKIAEDPERDSKAQASAGGEFRRGKDHEWGADDGGHLIGARFGGETGEENLTAQNRNLNRSDYKQMENDWAARLEDGEKVFVHIEAEDRMPIWVTRFTNHRMVRVILIRFIWSMRAEAKLQAGKKKQLNGKRQKNMINSRNR